MGYSLELLTDLLTICRLTPNTPVPDLKAIKGYYALVQTSDETTLICPQHYAPRGVPAEIGWRALEVRGPLEFDMIGVLSDLAGCLAEAKISIYVLSTYDTDIIFVKDRMLKIAITALQKAGHVIIEPPNYQLG
jgi:uncharacterized protein